MASYGRNLLPASTVSDFRVSADGAPLVKAGGLTLDLTTIPAAAGTDTVLPNGDIIKAGSQFLRYGQVLTRNTSVDVQTIAVTGTPTGGTFTLTYNGVASGAIAFNAAAADVVTALNAIPALLDEVTATGGPFPGTAVVVTFSSRLGAAAVLALGTNALTGGTTPTATVTHTTTGVAASGKFGPYDPAATDGRQVLTRGDVFILDTTILVNPSILPGVGSIDVQGAILGGYLFKKRVLQAGGGTHSLAAGPTLAELEAVMPNIMWVQN